MTDAMRDSGTVKNQYADDSNLRTRVSLHAKYSTNKQGFGNWMFSHYGDFKGSRILELGCGTGDFWKERKESIAGYARLVISDSSDGMLRTARQNIGDAPNVEFRRIDMQSIPYADASFDFIIAHMMLYHVPSLDKALSEAARTLKPSGEFYCATFGENGLSRYINALFSKHGIRMNIESSFTLQNGGEKLRPYFSKVQRLDYQDSLEITDSADLAEYILSMSSIINTADVCLGQLVEILENEKDADGIIRIPKEYGMFIATP